MAVVFEAVLDTTFLLKLLGCGSVMLAGLVWTASDIVLGDGSGFEEEAATFAGVSGVTLPANAASSAAISSAMRGSPEAGTTNGPLCASREASHERRSGCG